MAASPESASNLNKLDPQGAYCGGSFYSLACLVPLERVVFGNLEAKT